METARKPGSLLYVLLYCAKLKKAALAARMPINRDFERFLFEERTGDLMEMKQSPRLFSPG
jgi:hypothetical protein